MQSSLSFWFWPNCGLHWPPQFLCKICKAVDQCCIAYSYVHWQMADGRNKKGMFWKAERRLLTLGTTMGLTVLSDIWRHIWWLVPRRPPFMNAHFPPPSTAMQCNAIQFTRMHWNPKKHFAELYHKAECSVHVWHICSTHCVHVV